MRRYHCLYLWLCVLLWCASMPASAQVWHVIPSSSIDYQDYHRIGVRFGISGALGQSPFFSGFTSPQAPTNQINMGIEYGKSYGQLEWDIHCRLTRQLFDTTTIATTLGLYDRDIDRSAKIAFRADKRTIDGLMLGIGGRAMIGKPERNKVVFFLRGFAGLQFLTYNDFTVSVSNRTSLRTDTTAHVSGSSTLLGYLGLIPGIEYRSGFVGLSIEFLGWQLYSSNGIGLHLFHLGTCVFF